MTSNMHDFLGGSEWRFGEQGWDPGKLQANETLFTLGNGYVGSRGVLEELPAGSKPGTFFSSLYDKTSSQVQEGVNAPNPIFIHLLADDNAVNIADTKILDHERILDIGRGLLYRKTIFQLKGSPKKRLQYESLRFFSMANPHLACMKIILTPLDGSINFSLKSKIDIRVTNTGVATGGTNKHFFISEMLADEKDVYLCAETFEYETLIGYAAAMTLDIGSKPSRQNKSHFEFSLKKNQPATITKYTSFYTSRELPPEKVKSRTVATLKQSLNKGFDALIKSHIQSWKKLWDRADILIEGDQELQRLLRLNIYHLMLNGTKHLAPSSSVRARGLSGEGYHGHIFWDSEIFILPFFIYTFPEIAKELLLYRFHRLDAARSIAKKCGYRGAMFPWESAETGEEVTPAWHQDLDGALIKIVTMDEEHHITADIAYAVWHYYQATCDDDFLINYGLEILIETARFWASRVALDKKSGSYLIKQVIGPDEFHESVDNNAYTNILAGWNLLVAEEGIRASKGKSTKLLKKLKVTKKERDEWATIARSLYQTKANKGIIEQFDGFHKKRDVPLPDIDSSGLPRMPEGTTHQTIGDTQFVKQADVILIFHLLPYLVAEEQAKLNFSFYESRTLHKSSLSAPIHAAVAARLGFEETAYRYLMIGAATDAKDVYGNTPEGIHTAALGGTWQAIVVGFCGLTIQDNLLSLAPRLPLKCSSLKLKINWHGEVVSLAVEHKVLKVRWSGRSRLNLVIFGQRQTLEPAKWQNFLMPHNPKGRGRVKGVF